MPDLVEEVKEEEALGDDHLPPPRQSLYRRVKDPNADVPTGFQLLHKYATTVYASVVMGPLYPLEGINLESDGLIDGTGDDGKYLV